MKRSLLTVVLAAILAGCSATIEYHPFVGEEQILQGNGGACDLEEGIEIWVKGAPSKPFTVIGYVDGEYTDGIGEKSALKRLIVEKVKEVSGSGVILTSRRSSLGDSYFVGRVLVTDTNFKDEFVVFRYQPDIEMPGKCAKFCVCQVLEGGGRNLSPLFYDVG